MKTIKKYWAIIIGSILAAFGIGVAVKKKLNDKQIAKSDKKIDDNKQQADVISGKVEAIENQKFDSRESARETIKEQLGDYEGGVSILRLTDFMDEVNNQELDNLQFSFISYIQINLDLSK